MPQSPNSPSWIAWPSSLSKTMSSENSKLRTPLTGRSSLSPLNKQESKTCWGTPSMGELRRNGDIRHPEQNSVDNNEGWLSVVHHPWTDLKYDGETLRVREHIYQLFNWSANGAIMRDYRRSQGLNEFLRIQWSSALEHEIVLYQTPEVKDLANASATNTKSSLPITSFIFMRVVQPTGYDGR